MRIKRIEINGFKSFADKTEIDMGDGLTAVVGPNGSGKSNLAEAVKWVLGEQSARILRGTRMDDVIFSGTAKRKSVGFAEVTLVFDNTAGKLPLEYSEVAISRRVYRSGEGEYYINRKLCRLKDITELFLDTGIGKDSYSFVGQGRIDEILSADPRERRAIFEEAAGISRYKMRKRDTENRLNETEQNLRRVLDIASELESQLVPLGVEAEKARQYLSLGEKRRIWEKELLLYELSLAERQATSLRTQIERANDDILQQENSLSIAEAKQTTLSLTEAGVLADIQDLEKKAFEIRLMRQQRLERQADFTKEVDKLRLQIESQQSRITQYSGDISVAQEGLAKLNHDHETKTALLHDARAQLSALPDIAATTDNDQDKLLRELSEAESVLSKLKADAFVLDQRQSALHEDLKVKQEDQEQRSHVLSQLVEEEQAISAEVENFESKLHALEQHGAEVAARRNDLKHQASLTEEDYQKQKAALFQAQNKLRTLKNAEAQMDGLGRGARFVLSLKLPGVLGNIGSLLSTAQVYETAVEVALGAAVGDIVTDSEVTAKRAIALLKDKGQGRATFYPLDTVRPRPLRDVQQQAKQCAGFKGRAVDLVSVDVKLAPVVQQLLGNVLVVDSLETASQVARLTNYAWRIVTLDGDVTMPGGSMTGGSRPERQAWMLSRRRELEEVEASVATLEAEAASSEQRLAKINSELRHVSEQEKALQADIEATRTKLAGKRQQALHTEGRRAYLTGEQSRTQQVIAALEREIESKDFAAIDLKHSINRASVSCEGLRTHIKSIEAREQERRKEAESINARRTQLQLEQAALVSDINALEQVMAERKRQQAEAMKRHSQAEAELLELTDNMESSQRHIAALASEINELESREREHQADFEKKKNERSKLQQEQRELVQVVERVRSEHNSTKQKLHNLELRVERVRTEHEFLLQRLRNSFGEDSCTTSMLSNRSEAEEAIAALDTEIAALGSVRVSAISEYERLEERLDFLSKERADLTQASEELVNVILELDKVMGQRFLDGFSLVRKAFADIAGRLFGGAVAKLSLTNPEAPLDSGVDIDVQPPGKRLQSINLLSGGERALVAVALLCAVLKVKPTPFCILDEVDAPLDDANVDRLIPVLKELCATTQFLVITHTKGTMMASDTLYGVTMPEQGVSKILAVKVSEIASA